MRKHLAAENSPFPRTIIRRSKVATTNGSAIQEDELRWSSGSGELIDDEDQDLTASDDDGQKAKPRSRSRSSQAQRDNGQQQRGPIAEMLYSRWIEGLRKSLWS